MSSFGGQIQCACWILVVLAGSHVLCQDCHSDTFDFRRYHNESHFLDLATKPNEVIAKFTVSNTRSANTTNAYINVAVEGDQLVFSTTDKFPNYEKSEVETRIQLVITYGCTTGSIAGRYYQDLLERNNYAPEFSRSQYDVTVPLPLPKDFDLSPFVDDGKGVVAVDYDLVNNTVVFTLGENPYLRVQSVKVSDKVFRGVLRLKEQVLKLPDVVEVEIVGTDQGVPAKNSSAKLVITPDLTIEYNDPPAFKKTFISEDYGADGGNTVVVELVPGTAHEEVEYTLLGEDVKFFRMSVQEDKTKATVVVNNESTLPRDKFFLSVVVEAKRSELQKAECVILIDLKKTLSNESNVTAVEKTLSVLHLEEEQEHEEVFPSEVDDCTYRIIHQIPNRTESIFSVDESTGWIVASKFDREDTELFGNVDPPQFQLVLQIRCPTSEGTPESPPIFVDEIPYSIDSTYLSVIVDDINDHSPEFTFPSEGDRFAFPVARLSERLLPSKLLQVVATDLDAGLNAVIRYSIAENDHFGIDPKSGVVYPLENALDDEDAIELEIMATDRDGAEDGNVSKLKILVVPALPYQMSIFQVQNIDEDQLTQTIEYIQSMTSFVIRTITGGYTSLGSSMKNRRTSQRSSNTVQRLIVAVFDEDELISSESFAKVMVSFDDITISDLEELRFPNKDHNTHGNDYCTVYPYIIVMSVFIVMFVASSALCAYFWFKWRLLTTFSKSPDQSIYSDNELIENQNHNAGSTPPARRKDLDGVTVDYSSDSVSRSNRLVRSLSDMMIIDEDDETNGEPSAPAEESPSNEAHQRRKSIRFSEDVERIEVF
uniref:Cadherin domain-containing protein n=1 Tax=Aedes albopictus TaxID=7160 RepID=A0A1W7R529_AEDAL